ncbi:MAG: O-antigen ligase family protein [Chloroflexota bacterium]|nr:O-antigen ligase family protein [Chloroflexota bacterium]
MSFRHMLRRSQAFRWLVERYVSDPDGWLVALAVSVAFAWTWTGPLPPLANATASLTALAAAQAQLDARIADRQVAHTAAAVLAGPRGDFEQRGMALRTLPAADVPQAAAVLAAAARLLERLAANAEAEREALLAYDQTLMASTRELGPRAEPLRSATWPIVEHLKLYPPPLGMRADWAPPDAAFFAERAARLESGALATQVTAAIEIGRSTYALQQLLELDRTYHVELVRYAVQLAQQRQARPPAPGAIRITGAILLTVLLALVLVDGIRRVRDGRSTLVLLGAALALAVWYLPPMLPVALLGGLLLAGLVARYPALAAVLPVSAVAFYYRPRVLGPLAFPLNETLVIISAFAVVLRSGYHVAHGWRPQHSGAHLGALLLREWWFVLTGGGVLLAGLLSLWAPPLVELRAATRELRRTVIEPVLWATITLVLLRRKVIPPSLLLWALVVPATWVAADGLIRFALGRGLWTMAGTSRLIGLLPSATAFGIYLAPALAASLALALTSADGATRRAAWLFSLPLLAATFLTLTRGAWMGVGMALVLVLMAQRRWRLLGLAAALGAVSVGLVTSVAPEYVLRALRVGEGTGIARVPIWAAALRVLRTSPVLGVGLDQLGKINAAHYGMPQLRFLAIAHPHNLVLDVWLQLGLPGVVWIGGLVLCVGRKLWRARDDAVAVAGLAVLSDLVVHGMVDQTLLGGDMIYIWWLVVLVAVSYGSAGAARLGGTSMGDGGSRSSPVPTSWRLAFGPIRRPCLTPKRIHRPGCDGCVRNR